MKDFFYSNWPIFLGVVLMGWLLWPSKNTIDEGDESNAYVRYLEAETIEHMGKLEKELERAKNRIVVLSVANELLKEQLQELKSRFQ